MRQVTTQSRVWHAVADFADAFEFERINGTLRETDGPSDEHPVTVAFETDAQGERMRQIADEIEIAMGIPG